MASNKLDSSCEGLSLEPVDVSDLVVDVDKPYHCRYRVISYQYRYTAVLMRKVLGNSIPNTASFGNSSLLRYLRPPTSWSYQIFPVPSLKMPVSSTGASKTPHIPRQSQRLPKPLTKLRSTYPSAPTQLHCPLLSSLPCIPTRSPHQVIVQIS